MVFCTSGSYMDWCSSFCLGATASKPLARGCDRLGCHTIVQATLPPSACGKPSEAPSDRVSSASRRSIGAVRSRGSRVDHGSAVQRASFCNRRLHPGGIMVSMECDVAQGPIVMEEEVANEMTHFVIRSPDDSTCGAAYENGSPSHMNWNGLGLQNDVWLEHTSPEEDGVTILVDEIEMKCAVGEHEDLRKVCCQPSGREKGDHVLNGFWIGPDSDDGWGYVDAYITSAGEIIPVHRMQFGDV